MVDGRSVSTKHLQLHALDINLPKKQTSMNDNKSSNHVVHVVVK